MSYDTVNTDDFIDHKIYGHIIPERLSEARHKYSLAIALFRSYVHNDNGVKPARNNEYVEKMLNIIHILDNSIELIEIEDAFALREEIWHQLLYYNLTLQNDIYKEHYLKSDAWKSKRELVLERDRRRCVLCDTHENLEVHHRTYYYVGAEPLSDLHTLCRRCHQNYHENNGNMKSLPEDDRPFDIPYEVSENAITNGQKG